ncbi:Abi family protein [Phormidium tenue FACHB-886]|nr:Abi family protein [Phormidium tenue FACHB-886]
MKRAFNKPATTHSEQVALLQQRGMIIDDVDEARFYLQHLNYYRLAAYWLPFEADHATHQFKPNTHFKDVLNFYIFDRELRLLVLDVVERIEVSIRSQWVYQLGHSHGPHAHLDQNLFDAKHWQKNLNRLTSEVDQSKETFIRHLKDTYSEQLPPVWAVCEVMSLGTLSKWYSSLQPKLTRRAIASPYGVDDEVLASWLQHLLIVRNICAHHSRLWNRQFTVIPKQPKRKPKQLVEELVLNSRKLYNTLVILVYFMDVISPYHHLRLRLKNLLTEHVVPTSKMGFPKEWNQRAIWQENKVK